MPYNGINAIVGGKEKVITSVDVYKEIRHLQLEGVTSQRAAAKQLGISRNTVKKYWEGNAVPWDRKAYSRDAAVMTPDVVQFISACLDEDERERVKKQRHTARRIYQRLVEECSFSGSESAAQRMIDAGALSADDMAAEVFSCVARTVAKMIVNAAHEREIHHVLLAGGVASSTLLRELVEKRVRKQDARVRLYWGRPELSGDNACGPALIGWERIHS